MVVVPSVTVTAAVLGTMVWVSLSVTFAVTVRLARPGPLTVNVTVSAVRSTSCTAVIVTVW